MLIDLTTTKRHRDSVVCHPDGGTKSGLASAKPSVSERGLVRPPMAVRPRPDPRKAPPSPAPGRRPFLPISLSLALDGGCQCHFSFCETRGTADDCRPLFPTRHTFLDETLQLEDVTEEAGLLSRRTYTNFDDCLTFDIHDTTRDTIHNGSPLPRSHSNGRHTTTPPDQHRRPRLATDPLAALTSE